MLDKVGHLLRRMRWKAHWFDKPDAARTQNKNTYGFKSSKAPPPSKHLAPFENDVYNMVRNIQFNTRTNLFQQKLRRDVREITNSRDVFAAADKTPNTYRMPEDTYRKLLNDNITKSYKKTSNDNVKKGINREAAVIARRLEIADRVEVYAEKESYVTIKDHKEGFPHRPTCRLINPAKSEIGRISKNIIEGITSRVRGSCKLQQWRDTQSVIKWFKTLPGRDGMSFIKFDIVEFYPSITESQE